MFTQLYNYSEEGRVKVNTMSHTNDIIIGYLKSGFPNLDNSIYRILR